jgi:hypothetical protein
VVPPKLGLDITQQLVLSLLIGDDFDCDLQKLMGRQERSGSEHTGEPKERLVKPKRWWLEQKQEKREHANNEQHTSTQRQHGLRDTNANKSGGGRRSRSPGHSPIVVTRRRATQLFSNRNPASHLWPPLDH